MSEATLLAGIQEPADLRKLSKQQVEQIAGEIRREFDVDREGVARAVRSGLAVDGGRTPSSG